ncbi:MAG: LysM peptidoglycan-binding domain-containing protein [bacterium]
MKVKLNYVVLTCLIPFLCTAIIGCSQALLPTAGNHSSQEADTSQGEEFFEENKENHSQKKFSPSRSQEENHALAEKQIKSSTAFQPPDVRESDLQATDINPDDQAEAQEEIDSSEDYQDAESENGDETPLEEDVEESSPQEKLDAALQLCQEAQKQWEGGNSDGAMESLDSAYELLTSVDPDNDADLLQQKDDIRFLISKRTVEIYASRQNVVNGTHREIPLAMNEHVKREVNSFLGIEREHFLEAFSRSGLYRPMIVKELSDAGLPTKLSWLPLIESYFKEKAFSRARALGLWQFIPSTGCKFGLKRDKWVDERMDPQKSTRAAIEYLRQLHQMFGDWTTVLAAYNCGEGTVMRVIRNQHINYLDNFWDLYDRLPQETARYVPRFLAAIQIIEDPNRFGIDLDPPLPPLEYETITVKRQIPLKGLAEKLGIGEKLLTDLNPELRYQITPDYEYRLKIPLNTREQVLACLESIPETPPPEPEDTQIERIKQKAKNTLAKTKPKPAPEAITVRLRKGDTLNKLARKYGTTVKAIAAANRIKSTKRLKAGQQLRIPLKPDKVLSQNNSSPAQKGKKKADVSRYQVYLVKKGDYPAKIAKNHNLDLAEFLKLNKLSSRSTIRPGQRVLVKID